MPTSAIEHAQEQMRRSREELRQAQEAILSAIPDARGIAVPDLLHRVRERTDLPVSVVQRALWTLVRDDELRLSDEFEPERPPSERSTRQESVST